MFFLFGVEGCAVGAANVAIFVLGCLISHLEVVHIRVLVYFFAETLD